MLAIKNVEIIENKIKKTPNLDKFVDLILKYEAKKNTINPIETEKDVYNLLPKNTWEVVKFELVNCSSSFANGIRRVLVEELDVNALHLDTADIQSDDEFINGMDDVLAKNITLLPIYQNFDNEEKYNISLSVVNLTNDIIDVKASSLVVLNKNSKENLLFKLLPETNITIANLRPGKYLKLSNINITTGKGFQDAGSYTLLNNVKYTPLDITPYNQFTGKGTRSITHNCKNFSIEFTTKGTIKGIQVMRNVVKYLTFMFNDIKEKVSLYNDDKSKTLYTGTDCQVEVFNEITTYKFNNHYITICTMIAMKCYQLDENVAFCTSSVERYDTNTAILKIKHANANKLILDAINSLLTDLNILLNAF